MSTKLLDLEPLAWPIERLDEAIETVAHRTGLIAQGEPLASERKLPEMARTWDETSLEAWIDSAAARLGIEAEPIASLFDETESMVARAAPAILRLPDYAPDAQPRFLVLLAGGRRPALLELDLKVRRIALASLRDALNMSLIAPWMEATNQLMDKAGIPETRRERACRVLLEEQFRSLHIRAGWMLRVSPGVSLRQQARLGRLGRPLLAFWVAYLIQEALTVFSWWFIGRGAFDGQGGMGILPFETAWLWAWALVLLTIIPFQLLVSWSQSQISIWSGALFKQRLLFGALKMKPDELRHEGIGQFLGRVMESEAVEMLAMEGGLLAIISIIQLGVSVWILSQGVAGWVQVATLVAWIALTLWVSVKAYHSGNNWTESFRSMTNTLVEGMVGHRTRLAQEDPRQWHTGEDQELAHYQDLSARFDQYSNYLMVLPGSWLVVGLAGMIPSILVAPGNMVRLAVSLGGVMLAYQAFKVIQMGVQSAIQLGITWQQVAPLFQAAARPGDAPKVWLPESSLPASTPPGEASGDERKPLLVAKNINFRYRDRGRLILQDCSLQIRPGENWLVEGPSGGGKTTLAAILAGLRQPESGVLLLHGYDWQTLGSTAWRRRVVIAPQFHENHIFTETFAFNLLMGRHWPPTARDLQEAKTICQELGLGDLLSRMPSGWQQMVGENGWQLSHGERSRVFIARALLQNADLVIMDESFGALDPENLSLALDCARRRAAALVVVAHP